MLPRNDKYAEDEEMPDGDPRPWNDGPATGSNAKVHKGMVYAIQSPFTGEYLYPPEGSAWRYGQKQNLKYLLQWAKYRAVDFDDAAKRAEIIGVPESEVPAAKALVLAESVKSAQKKARALYEKGPWPELYFLSGGEGRPRFKKYRDQIKQGKVATNYWADDDYTMPEVLDAVSWPHAESGHSQGAVDELTAIVGEGHDFATVKPDETLYQDRSAVVSAGWPSHGSVCRLWHDRPCSSLVEQGVGRKPAIHADRTGSTRAR